MMMKTAVVLSLCLGLASASGAGRPSAGELIDKFKAVLPGAFPEGLKDNIDSATNLAKHLSNDVTGGNTMVTKEELEEAKRVLKLTLVANIAQKTISQDQLMDEESFMQATEGEVAEAEKSVDTMVENLVKSGIVTIVERDPAKEDKVYQEIMEKQNQAEEDQKTSGLVGRSHVTKLRKEDEVAEGNMDIVKMFGLENLHKLKTVEKRPDLLPGGESFIANEKERKERREENAMARRWRADPRPVGRMTSGDVLENMEGMVREIFNAYDHDHDNTLNLNEFNELQADTDGPDSVNSEKEFAELLTQAEPEGSKKNLHYVTFSKLYIDPWLSEKFETILPVDYHQLMEVAKIKGEALAETWAELDGDKKVADAATDEVLKAEAEEDKKSQERLAKALGA